MEQYSSPAGSRATGEQRCAWRLRIARARKEARGLVARYFAQCSVCLQQRHIMPDGRMVAHSLRETISDRVRYKEEHAEQENIWRCPGSHVYFGA